jgi:hypothetical protein
MTDSALLAVVEVPFEDRVRCAAEGCGHSVYRRVHLVRHDGRTQVFGSDCFARLFQGTSLGTSAPRYSSAAGRPLTPEERELLIRNTELLIEYFERENQDAELLARAQRKQQGGSTPPPRPARSVPSAAELAAADLQARSNLAFRFPGVNLDLPGFKGLVRLEAERILRESEAS